jgi:hypothetical protein
MKEPPDLFGVVLGGGPTQMASWLGGGEGELCFEGKPSVAWLFFFLDSVSIKHPKGQGKSHGVPLNLVFPLDKWDFGTRLDSL